VTSKIPKFFSHQLIDRKNVCFKGLNKKGLKKSKIFILDSNSTESLRSCLNRLDYFDLALVGSISHISETKSRLNVQFFYDQYLVVNYRLTYNLVPNSWVASRETSNFYGHSLFYTFYLTWVLLFIASILRPVSYLFNRTIHLFFLSWLRSNLKSVWR